MQAGQAHAQPPLPPPVYECWQTPLAQVVPTSQGRPWAIQTQASDAVAWHEDGSVWLPQLSVGAPASALPVPLQAHGGQLPPPSTDVLHAGQLQVLAPTGGTGVSPPLPPTVATPPEAQPQAQGGQVWPAAQGAHAQAQVPPVTQPPPPPPVQSQTLDGQV